LQARFEVEIILTAIAHSKKIEVFIGAH